MRGAVFCRFGSGLVEVGWVEVFSNSCFDGGGQAADEVVEWLSCSVAVEGVGGLPMVSFDAPVAAGMACAFLAWMLVFGNTSFSTGEKVLLSVARTVLASLADLGSDLSAEFLVELGVVFLGEEPTVLVRATGLDEEASACSSPYALDGSF